jgi:hypothetical protein
MEYPLPGTKSVSSEEGEDRLPKKPYAAPQLTVHGTVQELTKALAPAGNDGVTGQSL